MKKFAYAWILMVLLLTGCRQEESVYVAEEELVTLNYRISPQNDGQARSVSEQTLVVNKLRCEIYEVTVNDNDTLYTLIRTDIIDKNVDISQSYFTYSVSLFKNVEYRIVFWAYYQSPENKVYYEWDESLGLRAITVNSSFREESAGVYEDAFTAVVKKEKNKLIESLVNVKLTRPMGLVSVSTTKERWDKFLEKNKVPSTSKLVLTGFYDKYDALLRQWSSTGSEKIEYHSVASSSDYVLANELVFANGNSRCDIYIYDDSLSPLQIYTCTLWAFPIETNKRTNVKPEE
ncbi:MAG: hypothetical protein IJE78_01405 [Bacteroidaceae bacterium]|nr:hypothetical protein [Bacteroidaceae bacterium]